jgi:hypothetical protein
MGSRDTWKARVRLGWLVVMTLTRAIADSSSAPPPFIYVMELPGRFNTQRMHEVTEMKVRDQPYSM